MTALSLRPMGVLCALVALSASLLAPIPTAAAATTVDAAATALQFSSYRVTELPGSGDITGALVTAAKSAGSTELAHVIHLSGSVRVGAIVRPANHVYLVAEPGTTITWRGADPYLLRFSNVTGGVYGGTWDGDGRSSTTVIGMGGATVQLANLTVTDAGKYGIGAYQDSTTHQPSTLTLQDVTTTANKIDGVHLEGSTLVATRLHSTYNRRNGVQLSSGSVGTISASVLDSNGQAVRGSTDGKTGHGLGVASATAVVLGTSMSRNKVCGASLSGAADADIAGSHLDSNGRHGLGTAPGTTATVADSTFNYDGYNGVLASGSKTVVTLQNVTISGAKKMGLSVPSGGTARVTDSLITGARKYDIAVSTKGNLFLLGGNTIRSSGRHGITVSKRSSITISGAGNLVTGSRGDGLRLTGSGTTGRIEASTSFVGNRNSGIVVVSRARLWMVATCYFSGNGKTVQKRSGGRLYSLV